MPDQVQLSPFEQLEQQHNPTPAVDAAAGPTLSPFEQMEQQHNPPAPVESSASIATQTRDALRERAAQNNQDAQDQANQAFGPESQGKPMLSRIAHAALSSLPATSAVIDKMAAGFTDPKAVAAMAGGAINPAIPAAYFGLKGAYALPGQVKEAVQHPSPDNVQDALLGGATVAGATAGAAEGAKSGVEAVKGKLDTTRTTRVAHPEETKAMPDDAVNGTNKLVRAAAPVGTNIRFKSNALAAAGDLAEIGRKAEAKLEQAKGGVRQPDTTARVAVNEINDHLHEMYTKERLPQIQNHPNAPIDMKVEPDPVEPGMSQDEMRELAQRNSDLSSKQEDVNSGLMRLRAVSEKKVSTIVDKVRANGQITLAEADELARATNTELRKYEAAPPEVQAAMSTKAVNGLKTLDRHLTQKIDNQLLHDGQPGVREYERAYAGVSAYRSQLQARVNSSELNVGWRNSKALHMLRAGRKAIGSGPSAGIASASQAAVADIPMGDTIRSGFKQLAKSGIKPNRPTYRTAPALKLTPPPGRVSPATQERLPFHEGESRDNQWGPNRNVPLTSPPGRVPASTQERLPFNEGDSLDNQWGPNQNVPLTSPRGRVPAERQPDLNFNGADQ